MRARVADTHEFAAPLWEWGARASWFFVTLPADVGEEIKARFGGQAAGFGSLKVEATIGSSTWQSSVFPESDGDSYVLPLKKAVRTKEKLDAGDIASVALRLLV